MATTSRKLPGIGLTGGWSTGENGWGAGVNQNWLALSVLSQAVALDLVATLPTSPNQGDVYLLTSGATTDATYIAAYDNSQWNYISPSNGWLFYVISKSAYYKFDSSNWIEYESGSGGGTGSIPVASAATLGGIKVGNGLSITADGTLSSTGGGGDSDYTLPAATTNALGGVIVGKGLSVDASGNLSWGASMTGYLSSYVFSTPTDTDRTLSSTAYNVKGTVLAVGLEDYSVRGAAVIVDTIAGHTYKMGVATLNTDHSINSVIATTSVTVETTASEQGIMFVLDTPITLNAGTQYAFLFCDVSQSNGGSELAMYGSNITNTTMTYFGLSIVSPWRAATTDIIAGLEMDASNPWGEGGYFIGVMGAPQSILASSIDADTEAAFDQRYVQNAVGPVGGIVAATMDARGTPSFKDTGGVWHVVQPYGDYATNSALSAANNNANGRVSKDGDTMNGSLTSSGWLAGGVKGGWNGARTNSGDVGWTNGIGFGDPYGDGTTYRGTLDVVDVLDDGGSNQSGIELSGFDSVGTQYNWNFAWNGNITTPAGLVAFQSDLPIASNERIEAWTQTASYGDWINFPTAFSGNPSSVIITSTPDNGRPVLCAWENVSASGFNLIPRRVDQDGSSNADSGITYSFLAVGPK